MKDPSGGYLATFIDHLQFEFVDISEEITLIRVVTETYHAKALLSVVRDIFHHFKKMATFDETEDPKVEQLGLFVSVHSGL